MLCELESKYIYYITNTARTKVLFNYSNKIFGKPIIIKKIIHKCESFTKSLIKQSEEIIPKF